MPKSSRQTKLKMRKGFVAAPMHYRILMVQQFNDKDHKIISKGLIKATTPERAKVLLPGHDDHMLPRDKRSNWSMRMINETTSQGWCDVRILRYKGSDVAVFFKRQTSVITPEPEDPAPEGCIENDDDLWARLDLFSKSPRQLVGSVQDELSAKDVELERLRLENETQTQLLEAQAQKITSLQAQLQTNRKAQKPSRKK